MSFFMRLKVFLVPYLCLLASFLASSEFTKLWNEIFPATKRFLKSMSNTASDACDELTEESAEKVKEKSKSVAKRTKVLSRMQVLGLLILFALLISQNFTAFRMRLDEEREFRQPQLGELMEWINGNTARNAVFASEMALTSQIALVTDRPVTNHPHYENAWLREKTERLYRVFLCDTEREIAQILANMTDIHRRQAINFLVIATGACMQSDKIQLTQDNNSLAKKCLQKDKFCQLALQGKCTTFFRREFQNQAYTVLAVLPLDAKNNRKSN
jgi:hypothetical protein